MGFLIPLWTLPIFLYGCLLFWNLSRSDYVKSNDVFDHVLWEIQIDRATEPDRSVIKTLAKKIHDTNAYRLRKAIPRH